MAAFCKVARLEVTSVKFCAVKSNLMELTTKSACVPGSEQYVYQRICACVGFPRAGVLKCCIQKAFLPWCFTIALVWQLIA